MGVGRERKWMEGPSCEALGTSPAQGTSVAIQLFPLPSSHTQILEAQPLMKTKSRKGSVRKSLLLSELTYMLLGK